MNFNYLYINNLIKFINGDKVFVSSWKKIKSDTVTITLSSLVESLELVYLESNIEAYFRPGT